MTRTSASRTGAKIEWVTSTVGTTRKIRVADMMRDETARLFDSGRHPAGIEAAPMIVDRRVASPLQGEVHPVVDINHVACAVGDVDERIHRS